MHLLLEAMVPSDRLSDCLLIVFFNPSAEASPPISVAHGTLQAWRADKHVLKFMDRPSTPQECSTPSDAKALNAPWTQSCLVLNTSPHWHQCGEDRRVVLHAGVP